MSIPSIRTKISSKANVKRQRTFNSYIDRCKEFLDDKDVIVISEASALLNSFFHTMILLKIKENGPQLFFILYLLNIIIPFTVCSLLAVFPKIKPKGKILNAFKILLISIHTTAQYLLTLEITISLESHPEVSQGAQQLCGAYWILLHSINYFFFYERKKDFRIIIEILINSYLLVRSCLMGNFYYSLLLGPTAIFELMKFYEARLNLKNSLPNDRTLNTEHKESSRMFLDHESINVPSGQKLYKEENIAFSNRQTKTGPIFSIQEYTLDNLNQGIGVYKFDNDELLYSNDKLEGLFGPSNSFAHRYWNRLQIKQRSEDSSFSKFIPLKRDTNSFKSAFTKLSYKADSQNFPCCEEIISNSQPISEQTERRVLRPSLSRVQSSKINSPTHHHFEDGILTHRETLAMFIQKIKNAGVNGVEQEDQNLIRRKVIKSESGIDLGKKIKTITTAYANLVFGETSQSHFSGFDINKQYALEIIIVQTNFEKPYDFYILSFCDANELASREKKEIELMKFKILSSLSHELKTPLNSSINFLEIMENFMAEHPIHSPLQDTLVPALNNCKILHSIIEDLIDYSSMLANNFSLKISKFSLKNILVEAINLIGCAAKERGNTLFLEYDKDIPELIISDQARLKQILINLLLNANKYTNAGNIRIRAEKHHDETLKLSVRDDGSGIKKEIARKIGILSLAPESKLLGLGLTISNYIASVLGPIDRKGIFLRTKFGKGSVFTFYVENLQESRLLRSPFTIAGSFHEDLDLDNFLNEQEERFREANSQLDDLEGEEMLEFEKENELSKNLKKKMEDVSYDQKRKFLKDVLINQNKRPRDSHRTGYALKHEKKEDHIEEMPDFMKNKDNMDFATLFPIPPTLYKVFNRKVSTTTLEKIHIMKGLNSNELNITKNSLTEDSASLLSVINKRLSRNKDESELKLKAKRRYLMLSNLEFPVYSKDKKPKILLPHLNLSHLAQETELGKKTQTPPLATLIDPISLTPQDQSKEEMLGSSVPFQSKEKIDSILDSGNNIPKESKSEPVLNKLNSEAISRLSSQNLNMLSSNKVILTSLTDIKPHIQAGRTCSCLDILIVDDNGYNLMVLRLILESLGFKVDTANSGDEAIELVTKKLALPLENGHKAVCRKYRIIFMDLDMPEKDGITTTKEILELLKADKTSSLKNQTRILACTAFNENEYVDQCLNAGMVGYVAKPVKKDQLELILIKHLSKFLN